MACVLRNSGLMWELCHLVYYNISMSEGNRSTERAPRKDRLVQARVPRDLEQTLRAEAKRQRLSLSQLVRNALEDAFELVDGVVADVDQIVSDSFTLARNVSRNAQRLADTRHRQSDPGEDKDQNEDEKEDEGTPTTEARADLSHVYGWNELVLHQSARCARCGVELGRGQKGFAGLSDRPDAARTWLCPSCVESL